MSHEDNELARIAGGIAERIRRVCLDLTEADFAALCMTMARMQRRGEARLAAEFGPPWWSQLSPG